MLDSRLRTRERKPGHREMRGVNTPGEEWGPTGAHRAEQGRRGAPEPGRERETGKGGRKESGFICEGEKKR